MLLFQKRFHAGLVSGAVRLTFRLWNKPLVKPGGRYRVHPIGVVEVDAIAPVALGRITDAEAQLAGFSSRAELVDFMTPVAKTKLTATTPVFRVELRHVGDGDRVSLALEDQLTPADVRNIEARLAKLDAKSRWTRKVLALIAAHPRVAASKLAPHLKLDTAPFKANVVKLKKLGLTQSFEVGYELSPRGRRFVELSKTSR